MPLDAQYQPSLADIMQWSGFNPVPNVVLQKHQQTEIDKHPASWGFKHITLLRWSTAIIPVCVLFWIFVMPPIRIVSILTPIMSVLLFVVLALSDHIHFKGPAQWIERYTRRDTVLCDTSIPLPIRTIAAEMMSRLPNSVFLVGKLMQENIVLDPYLLIANDSEYVCVGVWDGATIIHIAQKA